ncbi:S1C family serine protease, partial [Nanoarchaeota archaeon]
LMVGAVFVYMSYDFKEQMLGQEGRINQSMAQLETKMQVQESGLETQIGQAKKEMRKEIDDAKQGLISADNSVRTSVTKLDTEARERDRTLTESIQEISEESTAELDKLENQLKSVQEAQVDFTEVVPKAVRSVVSVGVFGEFENFMSAGSGAIVHQNGYVITNYHVVDDLEHIKVRTNVQNVYDAEIIGYDIKWDLALLKMDTTKQFVKLLWADEDDLYVGQPVIAIGNPVGLEASVSQGIISSIDRYLESDIPYLQTDVAINPGNSGGPMLDKDGKIVGIMTLKLIGEGVEGLGFAIKSDHAREVANKILIGQN